MEIRPGDAGAGKAAARGPDSGPAMTPERYQRLKQLFEAVVDLSPADRIRTLNNLCPDDPYLCAEVESLLQQDDSSFHTLAQLMVDDALLAAVDDMPCYSNGQTVGQNFVIESLVDKGGMGEVYRARDIRLRRSIALKVLREKLNTKPDLRQRLDREAPLRVPIESPAHLLFV